jgi:PII-like signaling protein
VVVRLAGRAVRLSIVVGEGHLWHHKPVSAEIVHRAHKAGLAGATVVRGIEGFGASSRIHTAHPFRLSEDLPQLIVMVDTRARIQAFLPQLDDLDIHGLAFVEDVEVIRYQPAERRTSSTRPSSPHNQG